MRLTPAESAQLKRWLVAHSGFRAGQCDQHPRVREMVDQQIIDLVEQELGFSPTRASIAYHCRVLGVKRRAKRGPPALPKPRRTSRERQARYMERLKADPARLRAYKDRRSARRSGTAR